MKTKQIIFKKLFDKKLLTELKKSLKQTERINLGSFEQYLPKKKKK